MKNHKIESTDDYIRMFPVAEQRKLTQMRKAIRSSAPTATEKISYQIPTFFLHENLVHFAAYKKHIGFYAGGHVSAVFKKELKGFASGKGSIQFPIDRPLPLALVKKITKFRVIQVQKEFSPFENLAAPAQRALKNAKINKLKDLTKKTEKFVSELHGMGPNAMKAIKLLMKKEKLRFRS